ncbi:MAG: MFS transporter [Candidatus Hodarchaeota archaeon]
MGEKKEQIFKVNKKQTIFIGFGFLSAMIAWSYYNFKVPLILNGIKLSTGVFERVGILGTLPIMELVGGALMTLDNIVAILLQPYFGRISDRMESRFGRRTPFVIIGIPVAVICLVILPLVTLLNIPIATLVVLFIAVIFVFNLAMAFYRPPVMSLMPDKTPPQLRSSANSYISIMGGLGFIFGILIPFLVSLIPGTEPILATGNDYTTQDYFWQDFWGFMITALFMTGCLLLFLFQVRETPTGKKFFHVASTPIEVDVYTQEVIEQDKDEEREIPKKSGYFDEWREIRKDEDKSAFWILLTVFTYLFGFNAIEFSFSRYATSYLQITEGTASLLLAIMPLMLGVFAIPAGYWGDKYGRLKIMKIGLLLSMSMSVCLIITMPILKTMIPLTFTEMVPALIFLSIAGVGYGLTHINALPVVWELAPRKKIGAYTGVYYMVSAMGSILSPLLMSAIYTIITVLGGDQWPALFPYYLVGIILGYILIRKVKRGDAVPFSREELAHLKAKFSSGD